METLRQRHETLESEVASQFSTLLSQRETDLILAKDSENFDDCDIVDVYDDINGNTNPYYVVGIGKNGMINGISLEDEIKSDFRLSDLPNLLDKINIVEILEVSLIF